ncbi:MAG: ABC transporter permease [Chitinophagaceae bacterium]|nr:ABC transporter permease [Chitinophagaceae bacterium]
MIRNYFKVAIRYLLRNRGYTAINVLGLAIGITCCILIMLFVRSEWSYDKFHSKSDRLYRAWLHEQYEGQSFTNTVTPIPLGPALQANVPEIESNCRVYAFNTLVQYKGNCFNEPVNMVDSTFFRLFDFKIIQGNKSTALSDAKSLVISEELAKKYFGNEQAIGKNLELQLGGDTVLFTVSAVAAKVPTESSIRFEMLIPHSNEHYLFNERVRTSGWTQVFEETYLLVKEGKTGKDAEQKIPALVKQIAGEDYVEGQYNIHLQPMTDIHLNKKLPAGNLPVSDPAYSYIIGIIGILVLLIACINFVTLSIGRSTTRALEVGVRKVMGAERPQLIRQFWGEALLVVIVSFIIAAGLSILLLAPFNSIVNKELVLAFDGFTVLFFTAIIILVGLIAGIYPAIILSAFAPVRVLKGRLQSGPAIGLFRKGLIIGQFVASIMMIISTIVIGQQLSFLRDKNLGYDREHVVIVPTNKSRSEGMPLAERFKAELAKNPQVINSSISLFSFSEPGWMNLGYEDDNKVYRNFRMNAIDADFVKSMGLQIISGRNFSKDNPADITSSMIVNEALVKEYGWTDPIGRKLPGSYEQRVIGVVKDFHFQSLHTPIQPLALVMRPDSMFRRSNDISSPFATQPRINIRLKAGNVQDHIASLNAAWRSVAGSQEFEYRFLDDALDAMYKKEQHFGMVVNYASVLSIFIACMGLFGLATLVVTKRTKEIGIRKVLGADVKGLVGLLSKDFIVLVAIAALIAFPVAWWVLDKWLQDFAYRIAIEWWVFIAAAAIALLIALLTVSFQAIKAAIRNPVKSLRTE